MKDWEYNLSLVLGMICLVLAIWLVSEGRTSQKVQAKLQMQQVEIERGNAFRQIGSNIIRDMMASAENNAQMRALLEKEGVASGSAVQSGDSVRKTAELATAPKNSASKIKTGSSKGSLKK